jgi:hypothetical protein
LLGGWLRLASLSHWFASFARHGLRFTGHWFARFTSGLPHFARKLFGSLGNGIAGHLLILGELGDCFG